MTNRLTLAEARTGLFQGILLASEHVHAASAGYAPYHYYAYTRQQADLAAQAAIWLTRLGAGIHAQQLQGMTRFGGLHPFVTESLRNFEFASDPQRLQPSLDPSGRVLQLGPGLDVSFLRQPRLTTSQGVSEDPLPMYLLESGRLLIPSWPDEAIGVSVRTDQAPWGVRLFFNDINAFSGERGGAHNPLRESFYPDHAVARPGTPLGVNGWRDRSVSEDPSHPGQYAANRFVPTMLQDALAGVFRLSLFGLSPEQLAEVSEDEIAGLIGELTSSRRQLNLDDVRRRNEEISPWLMGARFPLQGTAGTPKDSKAVEGELSKILRSDQSLVEMLRRNDPRTIPTLQGAGRVWHNEPGKDPYFDLGWNAAFGMTVFVVHPATFYEWTGIRHEPLRYWPETLNPFSITKSDIDDYLRATRDLEEIHPKGFMAWHAMGGASLLTKIGREFGIRHYLGMGQEDGIYDVGACATDPSILTGKRALFGGGFSGRHGQRRGFLPLRDDDSDDSKDPDDRK